MKDFNKFIERISKTLKAEGFVKSGHTLYLRQENVALIDFQKSKDSGKDQVRFTINVGIASIKLLTAFDKNSKDISFEDCHWKRRIGFLMPEKVDYWWNLNLSDLNNETIIADFINLIREIAIPALMHNLSDEVLKENWINNSYDGLTELQRIMYLTLLLKLTNDNRLENEVNNILLSTKGKSIEFAVKEHLKEFELL